MTEDLQEKYAKLWYETNEWQVPAGLEPFPRKVPYTDEEKELYVSGMWKILHILAEDGLIYESTLRRIHDEAMGWKPGRSKITERVVRS